MSGRWGGWSRLIARTRVTDSGCWGWTGPLDPEGYAARVLVDGVRWRPHRLFYTQLVGPIAEGLDIDHLCRNRACVNPAHLEPVTPRENILRGEGLAAENARRVVCVNGHPLDGRNTWVSQRTGRRVCRACVRVRTARYRAERGRKAVAA